MKTMRVDGEDVQIRPMRPEWAAFMRDFCTDIGLATGCPLRPCRRARRCATKEVICYQIVREEVNAILMPLLQARAAGAETAPPEAAGAEDGPSTATVARRGSG